jgi:putative hydrolase of HD superfamily
MCALAAFVFEMGVLKSVARAGWWHLRIKNPETVGEHSLRVAQLAGVIAAEEGADAARAAYLGIWHDSQETRTGDIPHSARPYLPKADPRRITADQTAALPNAAATTIQEAVAEFEAQATPEARAAHDADKLECLFQAVEYREQGVSRVQDWIDSSLNGLTTSTAEELAQAALMTSPLTWRDR